VGCMFWVVCCKLWVVGCKFRLALIACRFYFSPITNYYSLIAIHL
jgi:predicted membrane protein